MINIHDYMKDYIVYYFLLSLVRKGSALQREV